MFRSLSLFSGCGGLDLGLHQAGFRTVLATDSEAICAASYRRNFPSTPFLIDRIGNLSRQGLVDHLGPYANNLDLVCGGPPCPSFSKSRFYRKDKPRALDDPNGWETINGYLEVLDWLRPRAFLLENVRGLAYKVHNDALEAILERSERLGYSTSWTVLNAADYGVAQIRERCFVVGTLDGVFEFPAPTHTQEPELNSLLPWVTSGEVLSDLDTEENACDIGHFAGGRHHELLRQVPPGGNYLHLTAERGHPAPIFKWRSRYWSFLLKLSPKLPSWTIQARRSNNMGPFHWRNRILRIEEIKRLQAFPDEFELAGTTEQQWRQVGNAVPPLVGFILGNALGEHLGGALRNAA